MTRKVAIIGAGNIGTMLAGKLAAGGYRVTLFNRAGNAEKQQKLQEKVDVINNAGLLGEVKLTFDLASVKDNQLIHFVAGAPRGKDQTRHDLLDMNVAIAEEYTKIFAPNNPKAIIINAANPLDLLTRAMHEVVQEIGCGNVVIGMGSSLDSRRLHEITEEYVRKEMNQENVHISGAYVLCEHGPTMVPILSNARIDGRPFEDVLSKEQINHIIDRTRNRGKEIIEETQHSDVKGPAARLKEMTEVLFQNDHDIAIPFCGRQSNGVFMGNMGLFRNGAVTPCKLPLSPEEKSAVLTSNENLRKEWEAYIAAKKEA